jgi:cytochrome P450
MSSVLETLTARARLGCRFERSDAFIPQQIEHRLQEFFSHISPGAWLVDWIPILDYLPDFLAPWRKHAVAVRENIMSFYGVFYDSMKEKVRAGTAPDCFVSRLIKEQSGTMSENEHVHFMADLLQAGTETTATTMKWFYKACVLHPEAVLRAQAELDRVVGNSRLPTWDDRKSLPYLHAFIEELHRWATVAPLAFPHATSEADTYRGKTIPAGTTVMINLHAIHRNSEYYPEPESFIPERFFEESRLAGGPGAKGLPAAYAFGIGRRECPGKHVADANLYIMISRILWAFDVEAGSAPPPSGFCKCAFR